MRETTTVTGEDKGKIQHLIGCNGYAVTDKILIVLYQLNFH